jgi:hypothetical protein
MISVPFENRTRQLRFYHRRASSNLAAGLTARGFPRQRRRNLITLVERKNAARDRSAGAAAKRILVHKLNGLTTRGTRRVIAVSRGDAWLLMAQIDNLASALSLCFHELPPQVQARAVELEKHLGAIRRATT